MGEQIRRSGTAVRAYVDRLHVLMAQVGSDPLDEAKSLALVTFIVNNRGPAERSLQALEDQRVGVSC
ncbi:MAG: hypothetical protein J2P17_19265 [Mycobacterium sp.]|nr:hypothetical protein [Mycobacterium sp.]